MERHPRQYGGIVGPIMAGNRPLGGHRGGQPVTGAGKRDELAVAAGVDLRASVLGRDSPQQPPVVVEHLAVAVAELSDEAGRSLQVGEHEGDSAGWEFGHRAAGWWENDRTLHPASVAVARSSLTNYGLEA